MKGKFLNQEREALLTTLKSVQDDLEDHSYDDSEDYRHDYGVAYATATYELKLALLKFLAGRGKSYGADE